MGVCGHPGGHRRQRHQVGIGLLLAGEDDYRFPDGEDGVEPLLPGAAATEDANDREVGVGDHAGNVVEQDS